MEDRTDLSFDSAPFAHRRTKLGATDPTRSYVKAYRIDARDRTLADLFAPRRDASSDSSSSRRPMNNLEGQCRLRPSTPLTGSQRKRAQLHLNTPQGFVSSDPKIETRFERGYALFTERGCAATFPILMKDTTGGAPPGPSALGTKPISKTGRRSSRTSRPRSGCAEQRHRAVAPWDFALLNCVFRRRDGMAKDGVRAVQLYRRGRRPRLRPDSVHLRTLL